MKLHSSEFEKRLRRGIKEAVQSSPALRRESRAQKFRKHYNIVLIARPLIALAFGVLVWNLTSYTSHPLAGLAVINIWAFLWIFLRTQMLRQNLFFAADLNALASLPIAEPEVFKWQLSKFYRSSRMSLADLLFGLVALAAFVKLPAVKWFAIVPIAVLAWAVIIATSMFLAARLPGLPYSVIPSGFFIFGLGLFFARDFLGPLVMGLIDRQALPLNVLLPPGWGSSLFLVLTEPRHWPVIFLLLPAALMILSARDSLARLRTNYTFAERIRPEFSDIVPSEEQPRVPANAPPDGLLRVGPTAIEDIILSRRFLAPAAPARRDWFERTLHRWFNAREKALADFIFPDGFPILAPWKKIFRNLAIVLLVGFLLAPAAPAAGGWVMGIGLFLISTQGLAQFIASGTAFQQVSFSGVKVHVYAAYGIGFRELSWFLFKCTLVQLPLVIAFLIPCSLLLVRLADIPVASALLIGFKATGLLLASRLIFLVFSFSAGTNDSSGFRRAAPLMGFIILCGGAFLLLGGLSLFAPPPLGWFLWLLAMFAAYVFLRGYGLFYNAMQFDLMSVPKG